jgi:D-glycero-alpha-D-manno-heptose-7-phosphate kinase
MPAFLGTKYRVFWSKAEAVDHIEDIQHAGVRGCLQYLGIEDGIEVNHAGDLPARSGLGSSSAFTVGMLHALHALNGDRPGRATLANEAITVEQEVLKETVGVQDQIECAWGGINIIGFGRDGRYNVEPLVLTNGRRKEIEDHLVLVFTDLQRYASEIAAAQVNNVNRKQYELQRITELVTPAAEMLSKGDMISFGNLLHESWMLKRELSDKVTNPAINDMYEAAIRAGAYGGKILGAGGGGFFLFCVAPDKRQHMLDTLGLLSVPVCFEQGGSQLILAET